MFDSRWVSTFSFEPSTTILPLLQQILMWTKTLRHWKYQITDCCYYFFPVGMVSGILKNGSDPSMILERLPLCQGLKTGIGKGQPILTESQAGNDLQVCDINFSCLWHKFGGHGLSHEISWQYWILIRSWYNHGWKGFKAPSIHPGSNLSLQNSLEPFRFAKCLINVSPHGLH